jgi:signal transduction histidine kinase
MQLLEATQARPQAKRVLESVAQMEKLIQDLLDASKAEAAAFALQVSDVDPVQMIRASVDAFRRMAEVKGVALHLDLEESSWPLVRVDDARMRQVLSNVLDNALKFTPGGGTVRVLLERGPAETVEIRVTDSGPGISRANLARIFDRNWQAQDTAHLGSGLGLFIARGIVNAHGGQIWAESVDGKGARIVIRIPIARNVAHAIA